MAESVYSTVRVRERWKMVMKNEIMFLVQEPLTNILRGLQGEKKLLDSRLYFWPYGL